MRYQPNLWYRTYIKHILINIKKVSIKFDQNLDDITTITYKTWI